MAQYSLIPFTKIDQSLNLLCEVIHSGRQIYISYKLEKFNSEVEFGSNTPSRNRVLNLWEKTCFEFFILNKDGHYLEFNFSPCFEWNVFYFEKLRGPLIEYKTNEKIEFDILRSDSKFNLIAKFDLNFLPNSFVENWGDLKYSLNAVIMNKNFDKTYWALIHKDQRPNFHNFESFIGKF